MNLSKKFVAISLAAGMITTPALVMAEKVTLESDTSTVQNEEQAQYREFKGKVKSVNLENGKGSILVEGEKESMIFHVNENVLVTDMKPTKENKILNLKEGVEVNIFYGSNTPVALSMPAQLTPEVIVVNNGDKMVKVDKFNSDLLSSDRKLSLNIQDKEEFNRYKNKKLLVYYSISAESFPEQTTPDFVMVLDEKEEVIEEENIGNYIRYEGEIEKASLSEKDSSITVNTKNGEMVFLINDKTFVDDMTPTKENKRMHLLKGQEVIVFSNFNNPVMNSMPPKLTPEVIIIKNGDKMVKVDKFDENLVSSDNKLKLNIKDEAEKKNIIGKDLVVFYKESTKSIPAQTTPIRYVDLDNINKELPKEDVTVLNKIKVNDKDIKMDMYKKSNGTVMLPVRELSLALGYNVKWTSNSDPIEITKQAHWSSVEIGKDSYIFAKQAPFKLGQAPELKNGKTYVPYKFIEKVLKIDNVNIKNGVIDIKY